MADDTTAPPPASPTCACAGQRKNGIHDLNVCNFDGGGAINLLALRDLFRRVERIEEDRRRT